jgi:hypothetical protein
VSPSVVLDVCEKSRPTGIRSPDRPARSQSLYRLSYPGHIKYKNNNNNNKLDYTRNFQTSWTMLSLKNNHFIFGPVPPHVHIDFVAPLPVVNDV